MKEKIMITIEPRVLTAFDGMRGLIPRSTYLNSMMKKEVEKAMAGSLGGSNGHSGSTERKQVHTNESVSRGVPND